MTSRKLASAAAAASLAGVAVLGMGAPAVAQTDPPARNTSSISDSTVVPGQAVTVETGRGFADPGGSVSFDVLGMSFTRTADATGNARLTFTVPSGTAPGPYFVNFGTGFFARNSDGTSIAGGSRDQVPFTVVAAAATPTSSVLPQTGANDLVPLSISGLALVGIGASIVVAARRRRETSMPTGLV